MFVIIKRDWIEDYYEVETLFENVVYTSKESAQKRLEQIHQSNEKFLTGMDENGQEWLINYSDASWYKPGDNIKELEYEDIPWYRIQELKLEGVK